jgi:hypothetical protein
MLGIHGPTCQAGPISLLDPRPTKDKVPIGQDTRAVVGRPAACTSHDATEDREGGAERGHPDASRDLRVQVGERGIQ